MDEEEAAAYYDEMRRKGGGAAKLKQGLGYVTSSSQSTSQVAFPTFVKGESHEETLSKLDKESRLAAVRQKLKRRPLKDEGADADGRHNRKRSSPSPSRDRRHGHTSRGCPRSRSRDREHSSRNEKSRRRECSSRSSSSFEDDWRRRQRSPSTSDSRSSSEKRSYRSGKRREQRLPRTGRRSKSPRRASRRSRSVSPTDHLRRSCRDNYGRRSPSFREERHRKPESIKEDIRDVKKPKSNALDYTKLIPGYDDMTPAEKVKEKMKLQLSDTVSKDKAKGMDSDWERFTFNKNAPLDDDAKLDYFGDGTGARDDTDFLQNTGSTFLSTDTGQAKREAQIQAAHDAAIFGPPTGMSSEMVAYSITKSNASGLKESTTQLDGASSIKSLLSDQVLALQQGSWRERTLKLKQQRAANTLT